MNNDITQLSINKLLSDGSYYIIPMYQRNFSWDEGEITQLIQDVIDSMLTGAAVYYIGTLVVFRREVKGTVYETIDGQQRLTTLSLLALYLKNAGEVDVSWYKELRIDFESRERSCRTFAAIFEGNLQEDRSNPEDEEINTAILDGYRLIQKRLPQMLKENKVSSSQQFADYLFDRVQIMRVAVPDDTDLNYYFEVMNNRGEQLEKHEVLKSRMMDVFNEIADKDEREESNNCLYVVWEACANMERYVQMGFTREQRKAAFGPQWGQFEVNDFDALRKALIDPESRSAAQDMAQTLDEIIDGATKSVGKDGKEDESLDERFNTVINFPNFLLQVLRVESGRDIPLDDKRLIVTFDKELLKPDDRIDRVKFFVWSLLKCKYLFDRYVIKREFIKGTDRWSLKRLTRNDRGDPSYVNAFVEEDGIGDEDDIKGINRQILMLLSSFHVSTPTMVYKHWLNAALYYLFDAKAIQADAYLQHLESVVTAFVFDRFLADEGHEAGYYEIIYRYRGKCQTRRSEVSEECLRTRLSFGQIRNNLVFNFLDYCLWLKYKATDANVRDYEFTFRSSVEHHYPQHPKSGYDSLPPDTLNSFGNLCLISHSKNSQLSNSMPENKREYYQKKTIDSVKQHLMMEYKHWDTRSIAHHYEAMKTILLEHLVNRR